MEGLPFPTQLLVSPLLHIISLHHYHAQSLRYNSFTFIGASTLIGIGILVEIALVIVLRRMVETETTVINRMLAMGHHAAAFVLHAYLAAGQPSSRPSLGIP